jgi:HAD superfamily hydrolase (TIGR01509 family)
MRPAAVIFDCDGTLVDSEPLAWRAWRQELREHGYGLTAADIESNRGRSYRQAHAHFAGRIDEFPDAESFWPRFSGTLFALFDSELTPFDDAIGTARELHARGIPIGIASSSPRERLDRTLAAAALSDLFDVTVAGDEVQHAKPAPDIFLAAAELLGIPPGQCVAVEDSPLGVESALAAGMSVVAVARADEHRAALAPHVVEELTAAVVEAALVSGRRS